MPKRRVLPSNCSDSEDDSYEKQRDERLNKKRKMLEELNIVENIQKLSKSLPAKKAKPVSKESRVSGTRRFSLRLSSKFSEGKSPNTYKENEMKPPSFVTPVEIPDEEPERRKGNFNMSELSDSLDEDVLNAIKPHLKFGRVSKKLQDASFLLQECKGLSPVQVVKVTPNRIFSMAIHPSETKLLIVAGGKDGTLGLWDVNENRDEEQNVFQWQTNYRPINRITFSNCHPEKLYFTSYDGSVRCGNFKSMIFEEIYACDDDDEWTSWHSFTSPHNLLVGRGDGTVAMVDIRTPRTSSEHLYLCDYQTGRRNGIKCVDVHPLQQNYFVTSSQNGSVYVWDERYLPEVRKGSKKLHYVAHLPHTRHVPSAFFSRLTGKRILTTCLDNYFRIYDASTTTQVSLLKEIAHNNFTGRWLTPFKPEWHPSSDEIFVSGSMSHPRRVELFNEKKSQPVFTFQNDVIGSVCSINAFHASRIILAGANSSGRVHLIM